MNSIGGVNRFVAVVYRRSACHRRVYPYNSCVVASSRRRVASLRAAPSTNYICEAFYFLRPLVGIRSNRLVSCERSPPRLNNTIICYYLQFFYYNLYSCLLRLFYLRFKLYNNTYRYNKIYHMFLSASKPNRFARSY